MRNILLNFVGDHPGVSHDEEVAFAQPKMGQVLPITDFSLTFYNLNQIKRLRTVSMYVVPEATYEGSSKGAISTQSGVGGSCLRKMEN